jgi:hypothetical protein
MFIISRNGKTTVISGWRAWLLGALVFAVTASVVALCALLALGVALTLTMVLFIAVPVVIGIALLGSLFRGSLLRSRR